jgi:hypothetical protein
MFDIKTAVVSSIDASSAIRSDASVICYTNKEADELIIGGKSPFTAQNNKFVLGDCKETRSKFSRGFNRVEIELHINYYWRKPESATYAYNESMSNLLQSLLTNDELSQSYAMVNSLDAEPAESIHENIWRKRYILKIITYEATTA